MADVWATVAEASEDTQSMLADAMERRSLDPIFTGMRDRYIAELGDLSGQRVAEMGCGPGDVLRALIDQSGAQEGVGVDPSPVMIDRARARHADQPALRFAVGDARETDLAENSLDMIVFHTTMCHIPEPHRVLTEVARILKPGGRLVVFDGDYATTTAALGPNDPVQLVLQNAMQNLVHDPYFCRSMRALVADAKLLIERHDVLPYLAMGASDFIGSLVTRGAHFLQSDALIGAAGAKALVDEFERRVAEGRFFGFVAFHLLVARKDGVAA